MSKEHVTSPLTCSSQEAGGRQEVGVRLPARPCQARSAEGLGQGRGRPASILSFAQNPAKAQTRKFMHPPHPAGSTRAY